MTNPPIAALEKLAKDTHIENKKYFDKLKKRVPKNLDYVMQDLHDAEFKKTDCLECLNIAIKAARAAGAIINRGSQDLEIGRAHV